jgi:rRNA maturation RNase YbeY
MPKRLRPLPSIEALSHGDSIAFHSHRIRFRLDGPRRIRQWLLRVAAGEGCAVGRLTYIFCSDGHLLGLNRKFLGHDEFTDILTFRLGEPGRGKKAPLEAEIYISIPRVRENAKAYGVRFGDELHRVMVHGLLHLTGYDDKTPRQACRMRAREDECLSLLSF